MRLLDNWDRVLRYAWSIRLMLLAGLLSGIEVFLPLIDGIIPIPRGIFASLSGLVTMFALIARLMAQSKISGDPNG